MVMGVCSLLCLLKSTTSSLVLSMLSERCLLTPFSPGTNLLSVGRLIIVSDQAYHVVSSANLTMTLELCVAVQSCVYREYRSGLRTQPWGAPVLRIRGDVQCFIESNLWPTDLNIYNLLCPDNFNAHYNKLLFFVVTENSLWSVAQL